MARFCQSTGVLESKMTVIEKIQYPQLFDRYRSQKYFFPLIASVLLDEQDGVVYGDRADSPNQVFVQHSFGYSQIFGESVPRFEFDLNNYLLINKAFEIEKIRLYMPQPFLILSAEIPSEFRSERQRFVLGERYESVAISEDIDFPVSVIHEEDIPSLEQTFGVVNRFWRSNSDFLLHSRAVVAKDKSKVLGICYAAALADRHAEIDVATLPEYRQRGIGKALVTKFIGICCQDSIRPSWDCFTNNFGSMALCRTSGFIAKQPPYPFFTIKK